jgi:hypothetical protein
MSSCDLLEPLKDDMEVDFRQGDLPKQTVVWKPISLFSMQSEGSFFFWVPIHFDACQKGKKISHMFMHDSLVNKQDGTVEVL